MEVMFHSDNEKVALIEAAYRIAKTSMDNSVDEKLPPDEWVKTFVKRFKMAFDGIEKAVYPE